MNQVSPDHTHDDTIISAAESLLRDRAAKFLTAASERHHETLAPALKIPDDQYRLMLNIAARCTFAAQAVESCLQSIADFHIRYSDDDENGDRPHAA